MCGCVWVYVELVVYVVGIGECYGWFCELEEVFVVVWYWYVCGEIVGLVV